MQMIAFVKLPMPKDFILIKIARITRINDVMIPMHIYFLTSWIRDS